MFSVTDVTSKKRFLNKNAVPSCNLPKSYLPEIKIKNSQARLERRIRRTCKKQENDQKNKENQNIQATCENSEEKVLIKESIQSLLIENCNEIRTVNEVFVEEITHSSATSVQDAAVQVSSGDINPKFLDLINSDSELSTLTEIESFKILNVIVKIIKIVYGDRFERNNVFMNTRDRVIMTYVKLKQNVSYSFLAIMFKCYSAKHCQRIFHDMKMILKC